MKIRCFLTICLAVLLLSGCNTASEKAKPTETPHSLSKEGRSSQPECTTSEINYASIFKFGGITYGENTRSITTGLQKGTLIGEIHYRMADDACLDYIIEDGDATLLEEGTPLYEVMGYASSARIFAGDRLFEAGDNPGAQTINDLLDIAGKIKTVRFVSGIDGATALKEFTPEATTIFAKSYPNLTYVPFDRLYKETKGWVGDKYWLEIEMIDGSTSGFVYNSMFSALHPGAYATPELASLIEEQRKLIYAK